MSRTPNLATRPLRNERLPAVLLGLALAVLLAVSVEHLLVLRELLPSRTAAVEGEVRGLEQELLALRSEARSLPRPRPDPRVQAEWQVIRGLVDRRTFSWARLLARLEEILPSSVKLSSIAPLAKDEETWIEVTAVGRTITDGFDLLRVLQRAGEFDEVVPSSVGEGPTGDGEIRYSMKYTPSPEASPKPAADPSPAAEPAEEAATPSAGAAP